MTRYSAHYGSWAEPGGVDRIEFGEHLGIKYLFHTESRREAFEKAQEVANMTGKIVTVIIETPTGCGLRGDYKKVAPVHMTTDRR